MCKRSLYSANFFVCLLAITPFQRPVRKYKFGWPGQSVLISPCFYYAIFYKASSHKYTRSPVTAELSVFGQNPLPMPLCPCPLSHGTARVMHTAKKKKILANVPRFLKELCFEGYQDSPASFLVRL
jgi:hypothetical protein